MQKSVIKEGHIVLYFFYDVAYEIELEKLQSIFGKRAEAEQIQIKRISPDYIQYPVPPVQFKLPNRKIETNIFVVDAKIYDFGVILIRYRLPIKDELRKLKHYGWELIENDSIEADSKKLLDKLKEEIKYALINPTEVTSEDYAIYSINQFTQPMQATTILQQWRDIGASITGERQLLSDQELKECTKGALSYYPNDLVIVGWNAAFVYDPTYSYEILDVIEYSVIELLELRTFDKILEATLDNAYDEIAIHQKHFFLDPRLRKITQKLLTTRIEIADVIDKVENGLKLFGDSYLVKVYNSARQRFGLDHWKESVQRKLETVFDTYSMLTNQLESRRSIFLEIMIILLFIVDILVFYFE